MWKYHQPVKLPPGQRNPEKRMNLDRRKLLTASASVAAGVFFGSKQAIATVEQLNQAIEAFTGGSEPSDGGLELTMPEIAENGHSVPVSVLVDSPMTEEDYLDSVMIIAQANPEPEVAVFHFSKHSGEAKVSTRIRPVSYTHLTLPTIYTV